MEAHKKTPTEFLNSLNEELIKYLWSLKDKELALELLKLQYQILTITKKINNIEK